MHMTEKVSTRSDSASLLCNFYSTCIFPHWCEQTNHSAAHWQPLSQLNAKVNDSPIPLSLKFGFHARGDRLSDSDDLIHFGERLLKKVESSQVKTIEPPSNGSLFWCACGTKLQRPVLKYQPKSR